jgi:flagellar biosynthesis chaperone FliJ
LLIVSAIISAVQAIMNARLNRINDEIEALQDELDNLEYAYERLSQAAERAFGTEYIQNYQRQLDNLEAQVEAYEKQLSLERSKGKKADEEKIKEYEDKVRDTTDAIKDMYGTLSGQFLGTDLTSAARDFASAWIDAYKEFSNTTDAMKEKFQDMIQNMVVESLLAKVMEKALEPVFTMIDEMQEGDFYSTSFWQDVMSTMQTATENGVVGAQNVMAMLEQMGVNLRGLGGEMTGISRDIATASEESILGLAAGINTQNFYISQVPTKLDTIIGLLRGDGAMPQGSAMTLQDVMIAQNQFLSHLPTIAQHTAETVAKCEQIVAETRRTADALERVIKPDGTRTTYKMNVVTSYQG